MKWNYKHPAVETLQCETLLRHCCWDIAVCTGLIMCEAGKKWPRRGADVTFLIMFALHHVHHVQLCICVTHRRDIKFANAICYHSIHRNPSALWWYFDQSEPTMRKSYNVTVGIQVVLIVQYVPVEVLDVTHKIAVMVLEVTCKMTLEVTHMMTLLLANGTWLFSSSTHRCR